MIRVFRISMNTEEQLLQLHNLQGSSSASYINSQKSCLHKPES